MIRIIVGQGVEQSLKNHNFWDLESRNYSFGLKDQADKLLSRSNRIKT